MAYLPRDSQPAVVQIDTEVIRATYGVSELFNRPAVTLKASYAIPRASSSRLPTEAPETNGNAPPATSEEHGTTSWLVGEQLEKARGDEGFAENYEVRWPFRASKAADDWAGREYILLHLYSLLGIKITSNTSGLLLLPPPSPPTLPLSTQALYTQLAFEKLNVPAISIIPTPLASLFALGATTGIVLHLGWETCEISIVTDSVVRWECSTTAPVGAADCEQWFESLLMEDGPLDTSLSLAVGRGDEPWGPGDKEKLIKELAGVVWNECTGEDLEIPTYGGRKALIANAEVQDENTFDVAKKLVGEAPGPANPSHKSKKALAAMAAQTAKANAAAAAAEAQAQLEDVISLALPSLPGKDIILGAVRHRLCEPLFNGTGGGEAVWEAVGRAVESVALSQGERLALWEAVAIVGDLARVKSLGPALTTYLSPFLLSSSDIPSDVQPTKARLLAIPDYFANFKGSSTDLAPFLGGSMVSKTAFNDLSLFVHKRDYDTRGPPAIYSVLPEERS